MRRILAACAGLLCLGAGFLRADLVAPPTLDWVSIPNTATVGQTVSIGVGAHANLSDNSDGNNWNDGRYVVAAVIVDLNRPGESGWTRVYDFLPTWHTPAEIWTSFTVTTPGTHTVKIQVMDGRPWFSSEYYYSVYAPNPAPSITSQLSLTVAQQQTFSYTITGTNSPTSFAAQNLPPGTSINTSTGVISGTITTPGTYTPTISATNSAGTGSATLTLTVDAASFTVSGQVSPTSVVNGSAVSLTRSGTSKFPIAWIESSVLRPDGSWVGFERGSAGTTTWYPNGGPGTYYLAVRIVDIYYNFADAQYTSFTVTQPAINAPTDIQAGTLGSTFIALTWTGAGAQVGIDHYNVYRNGSFIGTSTTASFTDTGVSPWGTYTYTICTVDTQGNVSPVSPAFTFTAARPLEVFTPLP